MGLIVTEIKVQIRVAQIIIVGDLHSAVCSKGFVYLLFYVLADDHPLSSIIRKKTRVFLMGK